MPRSTRASLAALLGPSSSNARARALLSDAGTPRALLAAALGSHPGASLTAAEAQSLRAAWRFIRACIRPSAARPLSTPEDVARLLPSLGTATHEAFWIIGVDARLRPLLVRRAALGVPTGLAVSLAAALRLPVGVGAAGVFLVHNHPGGTPEASSDDLALTHSFRRACEYLGLCLHDHVIVAGERWRSCVTGASGASWLPRPRAAPRVPVPRGLSDPAGYALAPS